MISGRFIMDDIRDITSGSNSDQNGGSTQQSTTPNQYSPYGQQGQYGQQRQYGQYGQTPDPQEDMFPTTPVKQKKLSLPAIIVVIIVLGVFVFGLITLAPAYSVARKYGKALVKGEDVDKISELVFPEKLVKNGDSVYGAFKGVVQEAIDEINDMTNAKFSSVKIGKSIKSGDLRNIEKYYKFLCDLAEVKTRVKIEKGYECQIRFKGNGNKYYQKCCVVKMKGEGWKIFPGSLDELESMMVMIDKLNDLDLEF